MQSDLLDRRSDAASSKRESAVTVHVREDGDWDLPDQELTIPLGYGSDPRWLSVFRDGLQQRPLRVEAVRDGRLAGVLPLALVESRLFGRFRVSLPYVNTAGVIAAQDRVARAALGEVVRGGDQVRGLSGRFPEEVDIQGFDVAHVEHARGNAAIL